MNIALLIAGGSGNRMGQDIPKQFMHVDNCHIIIHTLKCFEQHPGIDAIGRPCDKLIHTHKQDLITQQWHLQNDRGRRIQEGL